MNGEWIVFFCFKQKTAYEMRISDWSSDVCSSDLAAQVFQDPSLYQHNSDQPWMKFIPCRRQEASAPPDARLPAGIMSRGQGYAKVRRQIGRASCRERVCQYV